MKSFLQVLNTDKPSSSTLYRFLNLRHLRLKMWILLLGIFLGGQLPAQDWTATLQSASNPNFFEIRQQFNDYWAGKTIEKGKGYKAFKRWEWYWETRINPDGTFPDPNLALAGIEEFTIMSSFGHKGTAMASNWSLMGPTSTTGGYAGLGRVQAIAFDPTNTNIIWVGAPSGGLWKTTDGGNNWTTNTDNFAVLGISGIVITPSNPNIMYVATGDADHTDTRSLGVYKSTDGGATWNTTGLSFALNQSIVIRKLLMDPNDETQLIAATSNGIYRTTNSGATWTQVQTGNFFDAEAQPGSGSDNFYACTSDRLYRSTNNGATWTNVQTISGSGRIALAVSNADNTIVVALCSASANSGYLGLYRSTDSGGSYTLQSNSPNLLGYSETGSDTGGQGWYDLVVTLDPTNANIVYVGGVNVWKSTNAGVNWTLNTFWYNLPPYPEVHADKHVFEWQNNTTLFQGNDGGIYRTTNGGASWVDKTSNLAISQLYRLGVSQTTNAVITGLQDNGTKLRSNAGTWSDVIGGDGMECLIDYSNAQYMYGELYYGDIYRSTNTGASFPTNISNNITGGTPAGGAWITPFIQSPSAPATLYAGYRDVYKTTDRGNSWTKISTNLTGGVSLQHLAEAPSSATTLYAGTYSNLYRTVNGGTTWNTMTIPAGAGSMTYLIVHPTDANTIYVTMSNYTAGQKVFKSTNGGSTWTNISGTLPNLPANCIVYQNGTADGLYVGMDVGVYYRDNTMSDWVTYVNGLPNVVITELEIKYNTRKLRAATYGRGLWETDLECTPPTVNAPTVTQPTCLVPGTIVVNATGTGPLDYSINSGANWQTSATFSGLAPGSYNVMARLQSDNTCITSYANNPVVLDNPVGCCTPPTVNAPTVTQPTCAVPTGTIVVNATGGGALEYSVNNGGTWQSSATFSGLAPGNYNIVVRLQASPTCSAAYSGNPVVLNTVPSLPISYNVTGGGPYCSGGTGVQVGLNGSEIGMNYQLRLNLVNLNAPVPGTGNALSFGFQTAAGNYTVVASNAGATCTATMNGSATVTVNPTPTVFNITGGGGYCLPADSGIPLGLSGSQVNVNYQLQLNNVNTGLPVAGTGAALSFGIQPGVGTYTVVATHTQGGCTALMSGTASIYSFNCTVSITDPCVCKNNATTLLDGQFDETIKVNAPSTQTWTVTNVTGLYRISSPAPPSSPLPLPIGTVLANLGGNMFELKGIHIDAIGYSVTVSNGMGTSLSISNQCAYPNPSINSDLSGNFCLFSDPVNLSGDPGDANILSQGFTINGVSATVFDPGQGTGTYVIEYTVDGGVPKASGPNDPGCIQKVSTTVHVVETPEVLNCNDLVTVSLDGSCTGEVLPDDVLEGTYGCFDDYLVELDKTLPYGNGPWVPATLTTDDIGKTYQTRVTHLVSGNKCWGTVKIEDKIVPELDCKDLHLICPLKVYDPNYLNDVLHINGAIPSVTDCSNYTLTHVDTWFDLPCGAGTNGVADLSAYVQRKWTATDQWGNSTTCLQYLYFHRRHVLDVHPPADITIPCSANVNTDPSVTGVPYIDELGQHWPIYPDPGFCELQAGYVDQVLPVCDGTYKILRTWTILDWCLPTTHTPPFTNPVFYVQLIKVLDETGPSMTCPPNTTVSIDPFSCCGTIDMPDRIITENCSRINNISGMVTTFDPYTGEQTGMHTFGGVLSDFPGNNWWDRDTLAEWGLTPCLPIGTHTVTYRAQDDCSNVSTCSFKLTVADLIPPVASCDQVTVVSITEEGESIVNATTFNDGSYDICCFDGVKAGRMGGNLGNTVRFDCDDIGKTITIVMRATDCAGNTNECMIQVEVQDKIKPACLAPANVTVTCEQFDPSLWLYGVAEGQDNCCLDTITRTVSYTNFDTVCNKGTIVRTFRAFDCAGNSSQCTQRIVVNYEQDYYVKFPNDVIVTDCDGTGTYGEPSFYGEDCELLGVSYEDQIFTVVPDACFKIERNWKIINWCTYNPNAVPLCIDVPNPSPNAIVNHSSNLAGPIVSPIQTPNDPWKSTIVKIAPTDALATNYSVYYNPNANCYTYKQIIKIIDNQDPVVTCPASPVTICDYTTNDPQLWNAMYWWDNGNQSHDLCEAPTEICLTATDLCSGSNINFEYQLFLDLDGDGTMETVVNSTQLGSQPGGLGWNNILYNNLNGAGTSRQFDDRPVAGNQKWGFALQETVSGTNKTACVKFNTQAAQNSFVPAQLPHGTHKIKWFVTDGCGNETICEYTIIVKDCKAPTVVCRNGLSVNIMPGGMITLWASDFLQYAEDNCTLTPYLKYSIRKCDPNASGFPVDGNGNPITNVTFDCTELGTQCVELWSIDLAGNADRCETYVIVQDNNHNCGDPNITISGSLKTEMGEGIEETNVTLSGSMNFQPPFTISDITNSSGSFYINTSLPIGMNLTITPSKDDNPLNGVTTYDLVLISKHILGIEPLMSPYTMIAADANKSNSITTFDIVELRKLILGIYQELPANTSWRFIEKAQVFTTPNNPFADPIHESITLQMMTADHTDEDFIGIKVGDVNYTAVANSLILPDDRTMGTLLFDIDDREVKAGETFEVTFKAADKTQGYQMTLNLNGLTVAGVENSEKVNASNFGVFADALTVSVDGAESFTVKFRADKGGKLSEMLGVSSRITKAEAYNMTDDRLDVALRFGGKTISGVGFELYQNQPNPFVNKTFIGFNLPEATTATLSIYDETGRLVYTQKGEFVKGYNTVVLDSALVNSKGAGALYYTLETATDMATKKMIQMR